MRLCTRFGYFVYLGSGTILAHGTQNLAMTIQAPLMYSLLKLKRFAAQNSDNRAKREERRRKR